MKKQTEQSVCVCVCVCVLHKCAQMISRLWSFLYGEYEAGLVIKQGFYSLRSLVMGPKDC